MTTPSEIIKATIDRLLDHFEDDPRSPLIAALKDLQRNPQDLGQGPIELTATVAPGGKFVLRSQDGREVAGVKGVAVYPDDSGKWIMQVTL